MAVDSLRDAGGTVPQLLLHYSGRSAVCEQGTGCAVTCSVEPATWDTQLYQQRVQPFFAQFVCRKRMPTAVDEQQVSLSFILERQAALEKREYVRFIIGRKDEDSHVEQGIFQAAAGALERQNITGSDADELNELRAWFSENLEKPTSFARDTLRRGISWFKTDSAGHISRIWEMVQILERNGISANLLGAQARAI